MKVYAAIDDLQSFSCKNCRLILDGSMNWIWIPRGGLFSYGPFCSHACAKHKPGKKTPTLKIVK